MLDEELPGQELNLQQLLIHAPDAIIVIDEDSYITYWNPKAEQIFGWSREEAVGKRLVDTIIPAQYREAHEKGMARYLQTGEARVLNTTIDITALDRTGREFYISLTISTSKQKGKHAFIAILRDIDQQKKNELELERKRMELEASNQELEQFAHVASHDLKEPVRKIEIFTDKLQRLLGDSLQDESRLYIERLKIAAGRMNSMIDGILKFSKLSGTQQPIEPVDLNQIVDGVLTDMEVLIQSANAIVKRDDLPKIEGADILLHQLFYNLINNALKFSKAGVRPEVQLRSTILTQNNEAFVEITVRDNGIGFDQEDAEKIFQTFARLNSKDKYEGTGLGLALCRKIVARLHGTISASSRQGEGATFTILLPLKQKQDFL